MEADARLVGSPPGGLPWDVPLALAAADGVRLRGALWNPGGARGHVLLLEGRTEHLEKLCLPAAELVRRGFAVAALDWRGQGLSDRTLPDRRKGHVDRFESYHADLAALLDHPEVTGLGGPRIVLAHSMGGCIALGAMLRGRLDADALVLTAPMLGIALGTVGRTVAGTVLGLARRLRQEHRWAPVPRPAEPYVFAAFEDNLLTHDPQLYAWMAEILRQEPRLRLGQAPTLGWLSAAEAEMAWIARQPGPLRVPGLCLLGGDEAVVDPAAVRAGCRRLGIRLVEIPGARHEILLETRPLRDKAWAAIDGFLGAEGL